MVAILGFQFRLYYVVAPLSFLRSSSLASLLTMFKRSDALQTQYNKLFQYLNKSSNHSKREKSVQNGFNRTYFTTATAQLTCHRKMADNCLVPSSPRKYFSNWASQLSDVSAGLHEDPTAY